MRYIGIGFGRKDRRFPDDHGLVDHALDTGHAMDGIGSTPRLGFGAHVAGQDGYAILNSNFDPFGIDARLSHKLQSGVTLQFAV